MASEGTQAKGHLQRGGQERPLLGGHEKVRKGILGGGHSWCKGPGAGASLESSGVERSVRAGGAGSGGDYEEVTLPTVSP